MTRTAELYDRLHAVSEDMVAAAQANDWDRLASLEDEMTATRDALQHDSEAPDDDAELVRRAERIAAILENHREVRRHVDPWMDSTRKLLGSGRRDRKVRSAYGAPPR